MAWNGWDWAVVVVIAGALLALLILGIGKAARRGSPVPHPPVTDDVVARHPSSSPLRRRAAAQENDA